jgi:uncharacterized protein YegP (UPF0339 family)
MMNNPHGNQERVEFFEGDDGKWYFHRVSANNEIVSDSEGYGNESDAQAEADKIFTDVPWFIKHGSEWSELSH